MMAANDRIHVPNLITGGVDESHKLWYTMNEIERKLDAVFFKTDQGNEPVREWLLMLAKAERKIIGDDVLKVQYCCR